MLTLELNELHVPTDLALACRDQLPLAERLARLAVDEQVELRKTWTTEC
jgi:hypothetical protein